MILEGLRNTLSTAEQLKELFKRHTAAVGEEESTEAGAVFEDDKLEDPKEQKGADERREEEAVKEQVEGAVEEYKKRNVKEYELIEGAVSENKEDGKGTRSRVFETQTAGYIHDKKEKQYLLQEVLHTS